MKTGRDDGTAGRNERDPEAEWKSRPHPWSDAGWAQSPPGGSGGADGSWGAGGGQSGQGGGGFWRTFLRGLMKRTALAAVVFAAVIGMFRLDEPWARSGQELVRDGLTRQMDADTAAAWYRGLFAGAPTFIPIFRNGQNDEAAGGEALAPPVKGGVVKTPYPRRLNGVEIAAAGGDLTVYAAGTGRVMLVSDDGAGVTVLIRHAAGRSTVYGGLRTSDVAANDWVTAGQPIGALPGAADALLYFALKEQDRYVDPAGSVPLD